jgi:hypothetical protein
MTQKHKQKISMKTRGLNLRYWQTGLMIFFPLYSMKNATNSRLTAYDIPPVLFSTSQTRNLISPRPTLLLRPAPRHWTTYTYTHHSTTIAIHLTTHSPIIYKHTTTQKRSDLRNTPTTSSVSQSKLRNPSQAVFSLQIRQTHKILPDLSVN